jgi:hypothetical protein
MVSNGGPVCQSAAVTPGRGFGAPLRDLPGRAITGSTQIAPLAGGAGGTKSWRVFADDGPAGM